MNQEKVETQLLLKFFALDTNGKAVFCAPPW
jgi:hypothetical protein